MGTPAGIFLFWPPIYSILWGIWIFFSVVFSPLAAGICMWLARRRGLNIRYYGLIGAIYSAFSLLPWLYLVTRMSGRRIPVSLIITGYVVLYLSWFTLLLAVYVLFILIHQETDVQRLWVSSVFLSIAAIAAVGSALALISNRNRRKELGQNVQPFLGGYTLNSRDLIYIAPFALAFVTIIVAYVMGVLLNILKSPF